MVSSAPSEFQVQSDLDGRIVTVEQKVVVKAIASDGNFEDGTPVTYQTSSDGSKILSLTKRSNTENIRLRGSVNCGRDIKETDSSAESA